MQSSILSGCRVGVVGGSIAGLSAARELRKLGGDVVVIERSAHELAGRGAGISMDPAARAYLQADGLVDRYLPIRQRVALGRDDRRLWTQPLHSYGSTWDVLYGALRQTVPERCIRQGRTMSSFTTGATGVDVQLADGECLTFDLLVGADGVGSRARQSLFPALVPPYAGYVIIRGVTDEAVLRATAARDLLPLYEAGSILYYLAPHAHAVAYLVPGASGGEACVHPGHRQVNWGWYVNVEAAALDAFLTDREGIHRHLSVPPGMMPEARRGELLTLASSLFPPSLSELIAATPQPFEQAIFSYMSPRMVAGRVCLVGDAAHLARPHAGSGALMAIQDARTLRECLEASGGAIDAGLAAWEALRLPACARTVEIADRMGVAHQVQAQDWESFTADDFERWWAAIMQGSHLYFERAS